MCASETKLAAATAFRAGTLLPFTGLPNICDGPRPSIVSRPAHRNRDVTAVNKKNVNKPRSVGRFS